MSVEKFSKHQRSSKPRYIITHPVTKAVILSSDNKDDFMKQRQAFIDDKSTNDLVEKRVRRAKSK